ncbi:hypothetical protein D5F51_07730 [Yersinia hibernica]|uniref:Uncharacterized protein n=1 Tax=Yersinia hibernica TaxID=2339259 RepID=A0ABX5QZ21_9GAMM|nr:hypothetical protein D5F51_07730 [Yersinia hibernica]
MAIVAGKKEQGWRSLFDVRDESNLWFGSYFFRKSFYCRLLGHKKSTANERGIPLLGCYLSVAH